MIFGIGLQKTGLTSLRFALKKLGFRTRQFPRDLEMFQLLISGNYQIPLFNRYDAVMDLPIPVFYPQFDKEYPNSKFILTIRKRNEWLDSIKRNFQWQNNQFPNFRNQSKSYKIEYANYVDLCTYGCVYFNEKRFNYVYETHFKNTLRYFRDRPNDLLVMDVCGGDGWDILCPFLDKQKPKEDFPHENKWKDRLKLAKNDKRKYHL